MKKDPKIMIIYQRGENRGGIHNLTTSGVYQAHSAIRSKTFKTLKGAQRFMEKWGYSPVETTIYE